jgi:hypothetical protein
MLRSKSVFLFNLNGTILIFKLNQTEKTTTNYSFDVFKVKTRPDFWSYMDDVFLPNLYAPSWYNNKTLTWREKLTLSDRVSLRVGAPRIRQLRVKNRKLT